MLEGDMESEKASRSQYRYKGLRGVSYRKTECLPIQGARMDAQERILGRRGWTKILPSLQVIMC